MKTESSDSALPVTPARRTRREPRPQALLALACAIAVVSAAALLDPTVGALFFGLATCAVVVGSLAIHALYHPLDRTTLIFVGNIALAIMFGLHPIAMLLTGAVEQAFHYKFDLRPTYRAATIIGFISTFAFNVGVFLGGSGSNRSRPSGALILTERFPGEARSAQAWGIGLVVAALGGYSVFALSTGQNPISAILSGARRGAETGSTAYFYLAPLMLGPAALLLLVSALKRRKIPFAAILVLVLQVGLFLPGGQRIVLILSALPAVLAWFMLTKRRLRTPVLLAAFVLAFLVLVSLRDLGTPGGPSLSETLEDSFANPGPAVMETLTGDDSEMIDSVAILMQAVPSYVEHDPFHSIAALISSPVPSAIWPGKPQPMDSMINSLLLGTQANSAGLAYSFAGEMYFDGGLVACGLSFATLGFACARLSGWYFRTENAYVILIYASLAGALINLLRGSLSYTFARMLFTTVPIVIFALVVRSRCARHRARVDPSTGTDPLKI